MSMSKYASPDYWEERYRSSDTTFDWFLTYDNLQPILKPLLQPAEQIRLLMVGCGNSRLSASLYENLNVKKITNVDVSPTVIAQMQKRYAEMGEMQWLCHDLLTTPTETLLQELCPGEYLYDFIIDKGLVDSILGGSNSFHNLYTLNKNVSRLLKKGGRFIVVSYGAPETRLDHFRRKKLNFEVEHKMVEKPMFSSSDASPTGHYHVYLLTKLATKAADEGAESDDDEDDFYDRFMMQSATSN
ncbi:methyltransferase [Strigomonas culicis]|uniref:Methyltransferase n=1 Tax=Strigomonas culicis TaxID=28005 RepID=S9VXQ8_9TRYP|nr:methyltransferase [Strigomonas culicis]EPY31846.1 methyltransferase [Strigomonas culicis]|eukprot:EPY25205.1 methyltransferase [Strigomonas culicis]